MELHGELAMPIRRKEHRGLFETRFCNIFPYLCKTSVVWHPHVSHWLASSGEDGSVRVWDVRSTRIPVRDARLAHAGGFLFFCFLFVFCFSFVVVVVFPIKLITFRNKMCCLEPRAF